MFSKSEPRPASARTSESIGGKSKTYRMELLPHELAFWKKLHVCVCCVPVASHPRMLRSARRCKNFASEQRSFLSAPYHFSSESSGCMYGLVGFEHNSAVCVTAAPFNVLAIPQLLNYQNGELLCAS